MYHISDLSREPIKHSFRTKYHRPDEKSFVRWRYHLPTECVVSPSGLVLSKVDKATCTGCVMMNLHAVASR